MRGMRWGIPGLAAAIVAAACAIPGRVDRSAEPAAPDLRIQEMGTLFARIDAARARGELAALQAELDAVAADRTAWSVLQAAMVRRLTDADTAWAHLREVTVSTGGQGAAAYWAFLAMADVSMGWEIPDQARLQIEQALSIAPGSAPALARAGLLAHATGDREKAIALLREALASRDGILAAPAASVTLARLEVEAGDEAAARARLDALLEHFPDWVDALVLHADLAEAAGDEAAAAGYLTRAVEAAPRSADLRVRRARLVDGAGSPDAALSAWREVTRFLPDDLSAWRGQAGAARRAGDAPAEIEALGRVVLLDEEAIDELRRLAEIQAETGDPAAAAATLEDLLYRRPDDAAARLARARMHLKAENLRDAVGDLRAVIAAGESAGAHAEEASALLGPLTERIGLGARPVQGRSPDAVYAAVSRVADRGYRARTAERPDLAGTFSVRVLVRDGTVIEADVVEDSLADPVLGALVFWTIHDARFPATAGVQEFTLPFTFEP